MTSILEKSVTLTKWHIGNEPFTRFNGSIFEQWYIYNAVDGRFWGGFESEREAITFLLTKV